MEHGWAPIVDSKFVLIQLPLLTQDVIVLGFFSFQFNCTLRQPEDDRGMFWPPEPRIANVTFNMELYKTDLFLAPSQGLFSVAENGPVYVEVTN